MGGLTVVRLIFAYLPAGQVIYFGDTAHVPYGPRASEELIKFGDRIVSFLIQQGAKVVVAACNTSSSISLPFLQQKYPIPILGVVKPGVKAALKATQNKKIGVIATEATVKSGAFPRFFCSSDKQVEVFMQACPLFVPLVEAGKINAPETWEAAHRYLKPLQEVEIDTLVLGCTHYPFLAPVLSKILGPEVKLVDPAEETVKELVALLKREGEGLYQNHNPKHRFFASGSVTSFYTVGRQFLGDLPFVVEQVVLNEKGKEAFISWRISPGSG